MAVQRLPRPKHRKPDDEKNEDYILAESLDLGAFLNGQKVKLRGRHHKVGAESVIRAYEQAQRISRTLTDRKVAA